MTESAAPKVVVVLGMHRSGTSLVTRLLNLMGVFLGSEARLMRPVGEDNPTGFWEHLDILNINEAILNHFGGSWREPPDLPLRWETTSDLTGLRERAARLLEEEFSGRNLWGFKDPRTCLTLPFWRGLAPNMHFVLCLRNPVDVARSLLARDGIPRDQAVALWSQYNRAATYHAGDGPKIISFYDNYFSDVEFELHRLARFIGREEMLADVRQHDEMLRFVRAKLRHHQSSSFEHLRTSSPHFIEKGLYLALSACLSSRSEMSPSEFDSLVSEIGEDYRLQVTELWELEKGEQRAEDDRRRLEGRLAENEARSQELEGRLAENEARSQELEGRLAENEARSRELEGRLAENEDYRRRLESQLAEKDAWSRELVNRLESVLTSRSWTVTEPLRTLSRYLRKMTGTR